MESGAGTGDRKHAAGADVTRVIADAHQGFFQDLNAVHTGLLQRLDDAYKRYARPFTEAQAQINIQALNEEYAKAVQEAHAGGETTKQLAAAFEKYKAALALALAAVTDPAGLALLSQSMYMIAMYAAQLPPFRSTP
jgi:hypothetical protein